MVFSAPGNSITPNIGLPKYQMKEGLIHLVINLIVSFFLIKYYGIIGAAIGNSTATLIASLYVFVVSAKLFNKNRKDFIFYLYVKPILYSAVFSGILYLILTYQWFFKLDESRLYYIAVLIITGSLFISSYILWLFKSGYLNEKDRQIFSKITRKFLFFRKT